MADLKADVVICGAGIAGIAAAYHLSGVHGIRDVVIVDERPPLSLTSDKSTECYRNWWPGPGNAMVGLMNRSIDILENIARKTDNRINLNRRGYLFVTGDPGRIPALQKAAAEAEALGAGPARCHSGRADDPAYVPSPARGFEGQPTGSDLILDQAMIRRLFPYLTDRAVAAVHPRRCGWFSAQQLGMTLLEQARESGTRLLQGRVAGVRVEQGRIAGITVERDGGAATIATSRFVNAAGPFLGQVASMMGVDLPVFHELHIKVAIRDPLRVIRRDAPLLIWTDPTPLPWSDEDRELFAESEETRHLLDTFPAGVHARPEGGEAADIVLILWTYDLNPVAPVFPFSFDPNYPEIALRGLAVMIPGLEAYFEAMPKPVLDGGYYTKTAENRPLIGPLPVDGAYVIGAFSGFGLMAACAAGELLAAHVTGGSLPDYAPAFALTRYQDPAYQQLLAGWDQSGQI